MGRYHERLYQPTENFRVLVKNHFPSFSAFADKAGIKYPALKQIMYRGVTRPHMARRLSQAYAEAAGIAVEQAMTHLWVAKPCQIEEGNTTKFRPRNLRGGRPRKTVEEVESNTQ